MKDKGKKKSRGKKKENGGEKNKREKEINATTSSTPQWSTESSEAGQHACDITIGDDEVKVLE